MTQKEQMHDALETMQVHVVEVMHRVKILEEQVPMQLISLENELATLLTEVKALRRVLWGEVTPPVVGEEQESAPLPCGC